jgi:hypothetical protein
MKLTKSALASLFAAALLAGCAANDKCCDEDAAAATKTEGQCCSEKAGEKSEACCTDAAKCESEAKTESKPAQQN